MRVIWLSHVVPYPPKAGVLLRAYYLLKGLAADHDVDLITFVQQPLLSMFYADPEAGLQECSQELRNLCQSVNFLPIARAQRTCWRLRTVVECLTEPGGYIGSWVFSNSAADTIRNVVSGQRYDVAHFDHICLARYRPLFREIPATLGHHNAEAQMLHRRAENARGWVQRRYFDRESRRLANFEAQIAPLFTTHITCSDLDSERLGVAMPNAHFETIPNGVDVDYFRSEGTVMSGESLIFVGTMHWYPNIDAISFFLKEVWPRLKAIRPGATFDVVGGGAPAELRELAQRCSGVTFHGYVPDIRPMVDSAAVYVCPIRDGGGTKLKILDAFAMGKCVIAHPVACEGIDVSNGVDVVFATSAVEFANQIHELLSDSLRRQRIGAAARGLAERKYSFSAIGKRFSRLLECAAVGR